MEQGKNKNGIIALLVAIIVILLTLVVLLVTGTINLKPNTIGDNTQSNENISSNSDNTSTTSAKNITQEELEKIIVDELYIITNRNTGRSSIKSLDDIESYDLETLVINKYNSSDSSLTSITKSEMQDILNETCLSNMTITFNGTYTKNEYTKRNLYYGKIGAYKTVSFTDQEGKYILSVKYIFVDNYDSGDRGLNGYGNMDDLRTNINPIVQLRDDQNNKQLVDDVQNYLDDNFNSLKDKLATYTYTFERQNGKIVLTNMSVN